MKIRRAAIVATWLLSVAAAQAQQVAVRQEVLGNGLRLLLVERHGAPLVSCGWTARTGSVDEAPGLTGVSHLLEHLMFKGTRTIGTRDFAREERLLAEEDRLQAAIEGEYSLLRDRLRRGEIAGDVHDPANATPELAQARAQLARLAADEHALVVRDEFDRIYAAEGASDLDAYTTQDQTAYVVTLPANKLELWFWLESDRLAAPVFREFEAERAVVLEERRMRTESTPTGLLDEEFDAMFWAGSPYSHPVVGWPGDLDSITREQAATYFARRYAPNNVTAVVVGDFVSAGALDLARRYFGRLQGGRSAPTEAATSAPPQRSARRMTAEADTNPQVTIRFRAVPLGHRDAPAFQLLADLLDRRTGRLYPALVETRKVAVGEPAATFDPLRHDGSFEVTAEVAEGRSPDDLERAVLDELARLAAEPVGDRELERAKHLETADAIRQLRSGDELLRRLMLDDAVDSWPLINEFPRRIAAVAPGDIRRVAAGYLAPERRCVAVYLRRGDSAAVAPAAGGER